MVLSIRDYLKLWEYLEDLEDAVDLKEAKESAGEFVDFELLKHQLKKERRLR